MRVLIAVLASAVSVSLAALFASTATADAPTLDRNSSVKYAVAVYHLPNGTAVSAVALELISRTSDSGERKQYFVGAGIETDCPMCGAPSFPLLQASDLFDSPQLHGGINGAKLDVTLPVYYCVLDNCPATIRVSLVWEPDGHPLRDTKSTRTDTASCRFTKVTHWAITTATATGFISDGTNNLASGETSGDMSEGSTRIVGFGDPAVCLSPP